MARLVIVTPDPAIRATVSSGDSAEAYDAHARVLLRMATTVLGDADEAADVVHEAFEAFEALAAAKDIASPRAWLIRVTLNRCRTRQRRLVTARRYLPRLVTRADDTDPTDSLAVRSALADLRPEERAVLFLRFYLDLSESEIAEIMHCRPGTVKSRAHRGLRRMREVLDDQVHL